MNILVIGDPHFKKNNIPQVNDFIKTIMSFISTLSPLNFIVVEGDLLHTHEHLHSDVLNKAVEFVKRLSSFCPVYILVGNHDAINNSIFLTTSHWMNCLKSFPNITVVDDVLVKQEFAFCPYVPNGRFQEALFTKLSLEDLKKITCIFAHQELSGAKMGSIISTAEKWNDDFPLVVSGHIHDKHWAQPNIFYTGSIMQHAFGDSSDKTILLLEITDKKGNKERENKEENKERENKEENKERENKEENKERENKEENKERENKEEKIVKSNNKTCIFHEIDLSLAKKFLFHFNISDFDEKQVQKLLERKQHGSSLSEYKIYLAGDEDDFKCFQKTHIYKLLCSQKMKIVFKHPRKELETIQKNMKNMLNMKKSSFSETLSHIIEDGEEKEELKKLFEKLRKS